jgi:hypothetical protein
MKAIISHDIDHFTLREHLFNDLIVSKFFIRSYLEFVKGKISIKELVLRHADIFTNKWQNIDELISFNRSYDVPTTFFIAVAKGLGLSYSNAQAEYWIKHIQKRGCKLGVHLIEYTDAEKIGYERELFAKLAGTHDFGTRIHYIRNTHDTFNNLSKAGFAFDTSDYGYKAPYKIGGMWQFPFQIMDGYVIQAPKRWQSKNLQQAKDATLSMLDKCAENDLKYIGIDFHDRYFSDRFVTWKEWYMWLVDHLSTQKVELIDFTTAINELETSQKIETPYPHSIFST